VTLRHLGLALACLTASLVVSQPSRAEQAPGIIFRHVLDDAPLDVRLRPGEPLTEAVQRFHAAGENLYRGQSAAIAEGKQHYETWCQGCHLPDGSGRIGPSLVDEQYGYERVKTDIGLFEIVFGGGAGAMQPFRDRLTQDQILKVIAYLHALKP
jgi:cytochrome c-L